MQQLLTVDGNFQLNLYQKKNQDRDLPSLWGDSGYNPTAEVLSRHLAAAEAHKEVIVFPPLSAAPIY
jgi:hypothetical protein